MNVNKISLIASNKSPNVRRADNPINIKPNYNSVSFNGRQENNRRNKYAAYLTSALLAITSLLNPTKTSAASFEKGIKDYSNLTANAITEIQEDNAFQLAQTLDAPSITFDLTGNWEAETYKPTTSLAYLTKNTDAYNDFTNLDDLTATLYENASDDENYKNMSALANIKTNPWMAQKVTSGMIDFTQGDVSNIDPELIRATDYTTGGERPIVVPVFSMTEETSENFNSAMVFNTELTPNNSNAYGKTTITIPQEQINATSNDDELLKLVNNYLAKTYNIETMDSYAGDAIWHGISLIKENYEIFKYTSEQNYKNAISNCVKNGGKLEIVCPKIPISIITKDALNNSSFDWNKFLTDKREEMPTVSYITSDRTVANLSELNGALTTPLDILDLYGLTDDISLKEAYNLEPEKYESLLTSAFRQIIDNNNELISIYGNRVIKIEDLYSPIGLNLSNPENAKINLQPLAYVHLNLDLDENRMLSMLQETPTDGPTATPTGGPTATPTGGPTATPTGGPTATPTGGPTATPTGGPTATPTGGPTPTPTRVPTPTPTRVPTPTPTRVPTPTPTRVPTETPTLPPVIPTDEPILTTPPVATPPYQTPDPTPVKTPDPTPVKTPDPTPVKTPDPTPVKTPDPTPVKTPDPTPVKTPDPIPTFCPPIDSSGDSDDSNFDADDVEGDFAENNQINTDNDDNCENITTDNSTENENPDADNSEAAFQSVQSQSPVEQNESTEPKNQENSPQQQTIIDETVPEVIDNSADFAKRKRREFYV